MSNTHIYIYIVIKICKCICDWKHVSVKYKTKLNINMYTCNITIITHNLSIHPPQGGPRYLSTARCLCAWHGIAISQADGEVLTIQLLDCRNWRNWEDIRLNESPVNLWKSPQTSWRCHHSRSNNRSNHAKSGIISKVVASTVSVEDKFKTN